MPTSYSKFSSTRTWYQRLWTFLVVATLFYGNIISCSKPDYPNYNDHCASIVPESTPIVAEATTVPFSPNQDGFYLGGDGILKHADPSRRYYSENGRKVILFRTHDVYSTGADGLYKVKASLILQPSRITYGYSDSAQVVSLWSDRGALSFEMEGFWSTSTGKLCMVGLCSAYSAEGETRGVSAVLKLNDVKGSSNITSLIRGTLESLISVDGSSYFEPISLLIVPLKNYTYTKVAKGTDNGCPDGADVAKNSLSLPLSVSICSIFLHQTSSFQLQYASTCNSKKSCNPVGDSIGYLPPAMSLTSIQCSNDRRTLRFLVEFSNSSYSSYYQPFNPNTTLVAEGSWNEKKKQLCVVACRISTSTNSLSGSQVEDCSMRLSLSFPAVWSIRNTSSITGHISSNKTLGVSGYFDRIQFRTYTSNGIEIPGLKYEYTLVDKARESCPKKEPGRSEGRQYSDGNSDDMRFDMSIRNSKGRKLGWGYANPVSIGDKIAPRNQYFRSYSSPGTGNSKDKAKRLQPLNISYQISLNLFNASSKEYTRVQISAEGIYDVETGLLCMIGCKYSDPGNRILENDSMDCEILVNIQLPPFESGNYIKGRIESTRESLSPLYFEPLFFSAVPFYNRINSIRRMDLEIIMAMMSNTLICVFVGYQILYVKKHPSVFPFISLLMLLVLTLGQLIPLVLNFEALFLPEQNPRSFLLRDGGWVEVNEVLVRVITMVAFLLQFRLLQLVWSARLADGNQKASWVAEKKAVYVTLPLYAAGGLIVLFVNWRNYKLSKEMDSARFYRNQHSFWLVLRSYAGLVLDGFLLPQILLNIFHNSKENALSCFFYMGTTFVRLLPHAYDLYRAHFYIDDFNWSYMYADPSADYYSTAWDMIIPLVGLLFSAIIFLQQRQGGRFFLPKRFNEFEGYEKVPVVDNS